MTGLMRADHAEGNFMTSYPTYLRGFPFMTLQTKSFMALVGLDGQLTQQMVMLEHQDSAAVSPTGQNHFVMLRRENVLRWVICHILFRQQIVNDVWGSAIETFILQIYPWFPILDPAFMDTATSVLDDNMMQSPKSCLVLIAAAIGALVASRSSDKGAGQRDSGYIQSALSMLPSLMLGSDITSVQCLFLFRCDILVMRLTVFVFNLSHSIYYYCRFKPLQAYDFGLIASMKVQNLWRRQGPCLDFCVLLTAYSLPAHHDFAEKEQISRTYWSILLLER